MTPLDRVALRNGASVALVFGVPFSLLSRYLADRDSQSPWAAVCWLVALGGFTIGAGVAAWTQRHNLPLVHGIVCAAGTYATAQAVFIIAKLVRGSSVHWLAVFFTFTVVVFAGLVGGMLGALLTRRGFTPRVHQ